MYVHTDISYTLAGSRPTKTQTGWKRALRAGAVFTHKCKDKRQRNMLISTNRIVTVAYEVREDGPQGALMERMDANYPFIFMFGVGNMLPAWEQQLRHLKSGMGFTFTLPPELAYGMPRTDYVMNLPIRLFHNNQGLLDPELIAEGQFITLTDTDGKAVNGKILSHNQDSVKVDCNHALAGKTLFFSGAILHVREASPDELAQQRYIPS